MLIEEMLSDKKRLELNIEKALNEFIEKYKIKELDINYLGGLRIIDTPEAFHIRNFKIGVKY